MNLPQDPETKHYTGIITCVRKKFTKTVVCEFKDGSVLELTMDEYRRTPKAITEDAKPAVLKSVLSPLKPGQKPPTYEDMEI